MTDKQIIIDGIDVSWCEFFKIENVKNICDEIEIQYICGITNEYSKDAFTINAPNLHCERNPNCYYKQLSRKTQECEELKRDNSTLFNKVMETRKENEKLKNEIEACYNQVEDFDIIATSKSNKLKQAEQKLGQIRVIAFHTCDKTDKNDPCYKILQIIGEVE